MSETRWTPGPWRVGFDTDGVTCGLAERNPGYQIIVGKCPPFAFGAAVACTETKDNAHLIAAAPELYEALEDAQTAIYDAMHAGHLSRAYGGGVIERVEAALARARGEQP